MPVYSIVYRKRALKEYVEATAWYEERSLQSAGSRKLRKHYSEHPDISIRTSSFFQESIQTFL